MNENIDLMLAGGTKYTQPRKRSRNETHCAVFFQYLLDFLGRASWNRHAYLDKLINQMLPLTAPEGENDFP